MSETIIKLGTPRHPGNKRSVESLSTEMATALSGRQHVELDGCRSAKTHNDEKLRRAMRRDEESLMWLEMGCLDEAEECCREAVALFEELDGPEDPDRANAVQRLSTILCRQSRYREAEACVARAARLYGRVGERAERTWRTNRKMRRFYIER